MEAVVGLVERLHLAHVEDVPLVLGDAGLRREEGRPQTRAVEVVRPGVVGALEEPLDLPRLGDELRAAVPADVVMCAQSAPSRFRQTITERPATSATRNAPGSASSSVTQTGTHDEPNSRSRSRAWNSSEVYASGISVDA